MTTHTYTALWREHATQDELGFWRWTCPDCGMTRFSTNRAGSKTGWASHRRGARCLPRRKETM